MDQPQGPRSNSNSGRRRRRRGGSRGHGPRPQNTLPEGEPVLGPDGEPLQQQPPQQQQPTGPLTLEQRCVRQFPKTALARGRQYFARGRVSTPAWNGSAVSMNVQGSGGDYEVTFDLSQVGGNNTMPVACSCPAFLKGAICKHLWAGILQTEKTAEAGQIPESGQLKIVRENNRPRQDRNHDRDRGRDRDNRGGDRDRDRDRQYRGPVAPEMMFPANWKERLDKVQGVINLPNPRTPASFVAYFVIAGPESAGTGRLVLDLWSRVRSHNGALGPLRPARISAQGAGAFEKPDETVLSTLFKVSASTTFMPPGRGQGNAATRFAVDLALEDYVLTQLAHAGRLLLSQTNLGAPDSGDRPLRMDSEASWALELKMVPHGSDNFVIEGALKRSGETRSLNAPIAILQSGSIIFQDRIGRFAEPDHSKWALAVRAPGDFMIPREDGEKFLSRVMLDKSSPKLTWPAELGWTTESVLPKPIGVFRPLGNDPTTGRQMLTVSFEYAGHEIPLAETKMDFVDAQSKKVIQRNQAYEEQTLLKALQIMRDPQGTGTVPTADMHRAAAELVDAGWMIYIEGQKLRIASDFSMNVSSSTDWFDVHMDMDFGDVSVSQKEIIAALARKDGLVKLSDGSIGMLPEAFKSQYESLGQIGELNEEGDLRFDRSQGLLLNAVLGDDEHVKADEDFYGFREKVRKFQGVKTAKAPAGFKGELRNYQKEGLTWLRFLEEFNTGGILADDMGLGKTIQVLAFLLGRKKKKTAKPCLVVTPKSLAFNWMDEAEKFAPKLKLVRYGGAGREKMLEELKEADVVIMTYGTLRADIETLKNVEFDVAVIDEAQAIKNAKSQAAEACKKLRAELKIALTGTPIENSINDLLSILEFTNPGLLADGKVRDDQAALARVLKPFMLRRTKEKVLEELPDKSEQVLYCEMGSEEREFYGAIRERYRASIAEKVEKGGLNKSKLHVLEALLRLRQAACHGGLIDPARLPMPSGKIQQLLRHMQEVIAEGHKVLVFSQFTSLLAIVRTKLEEEKINYEYLDGQTEDRKTPVDRFQTDKSVPVFLISLKAGGTGLNLTAADYVFILDPWWNPAVEAQAIGRAHRMGQQNKVIAYRMIAKGTVEEKILDLQKSKKDLAESIVSEDGEFMKKLTKEDLEMLLE